MVCLLLDSAFPVWGFVLVLDGFCFCLLLLDFRIAWWSLALVPKYLMDRRD